MVAHSRSGSEPLSLPPLQVGLSRPPLFARSVKTRHGTCASPVGQVEYCCCRLLPVIKDVSEGRQIGPRLWGRAFRGLGLSNPRSLVLCATQSSQSCGTLSWPGTSIMKKFIHLPIRFGPGDLGSKHYRISNGRRCPTLPSM